MTGPLEASRPVRVRVQIRGIVQGVGFRPFLHRLAETCGLRGWARNTSGGVESEVEGDPDAIRRFLDKIRQDPPPLACHSAFFLRISSASPSRCFFILSASMKSSPTRTTPSICF